ncbi:MAG: hypothetical protein O2794_04425, partial [bacterium]|nr:hypothetical protein [bacterium]
MRFSIKAFTLITSLIVFSVSLSAEKISGKAVMQKVYDQAHIHHTQTAAVFMTIVDEKDRKRERYFNIWKKHYPEIKKGPQKSASEDRSLIKFYRPSDVKGTALLTKSYGDDQDDMQWMHHWMKVANNYQKVLLRTKTV